MADERKKPEIDPNYMNYEVWNSAEVAHYLRISARNVTEKTRRGEVPHTTVFGCYRFRRDDILQLMRPAA